MNSQSRSNQINQKNRARLKTRSTGNGCAESGEIWICGTDRERSWVDQSHLWWSKAFPPVR